MIAAYWQAVRRFDRDVLLYIASMALLGFAIFGGIYPVLFNLYLLRLGYGPEFVGMVNSVGMLTFATCSLGRARSGSGWAYAGRWRPG